MKKEMAGGFVSISTSQLANLSGVGEEALSTAALRCYLALFAIKASREAATRESKSKGRKPNPHKDFAISELIQLTGSLSERSIRGALRELKQADLATARKKEISINQFPTTEAKEWMEEAGVKQRFIPVPRRMLRFLAKTPKRGLILTALAYMMRGLFLYKKEVKNAGTIKVSWIAENFSISERTVKRERRELIELGFISKDESSHQKKLNRTGAYFQINTDWNYEVEETELREGELPTAGGVEEPKKYVLVSPPQTKKYVLVSPPIVKQLTPYGSTKTNKPVKRASGFSGKISFRNIQPEQLKRISGLLELYQAALRERVFEHSEANLLSFLASAIKAKRGWVNPVRMFVWTVLNGFKYLTEADEREAQEKLKAFRRSNPDAFEFLEAEGVEMEGARQKQQQAEIQKLLDGLVGESKLVA